MNHTPNGKSNYIAMLLNLEKEYIVSRALTPCALNTRPGRSYSNSDRPGLFRSRDLPIDQLQPNLYRAQLLSSLFFKCIKHKRLAIKNLKDSTH